MLSAQLYFSLLNHLLQCNIKALDYDFYMDVHEVTCDDYRNTAKSGNLKDFTECEDDRYPLSNVTYYDAVLFANAKSKLENYDTAYTYSKAVFHGDGHCTNLDGFAFHPEEKPIVCPQNQNGCM